MHCTRPLMCSCAVALALHLASAVAAAQATESSPPEPAAPSNPAAVGSTATDPAAAAQSTQDDTRLREEAAAHFEKGRRLYDRQEWDAALAEFLEARRLYPAAWSATSSAGACLVNLGRSDEALDMLEGLLSAYAGSLPAAVKAYAQKEVVALRQRVGTLVLDGAEPGAAITIDGRSRGEHPSPAPHHVLAGSHVVRVYKEGFEPFEASFTVAGGQIARVAARLRPLIQAGRLRVSERNGKALDVMVDGNVVGTTPWEGPVAIGEHTVMLRGEEHFGTLPAQVVIRPKQTVDLALAAEELDAAIRVVPVPASASVAIDGLFVGRGVWEGRLRPGPHTVEAVDDGYVKAARQVKVDRGGRAAVSLALARDPSARRWRKPPRFTLELDGAIALTPSLGGDIAASCGDSCSAGVAFGGHGVFRGGYEIDLGTSFGFGIATGYVRMQQSPSGRSAFIEARGIVEPGVGTADDAIQVRGFVAGAWAGLGFGERYPVRLRLGAGALLGSVADTRTGTFTTRRGERYEVGPYIDVHPRAWFYLDPEVRVGMRLGDHVELSAGVDVLVLIGSAARWDAGQRIFAHTDGEGSFAAETLTDPVLFAVMPGAGIRYDF
ncbi:PEGA domain-containing protein [Sorangium sp. So ce296]|uniref:PEGA domain-containing protein n=1 Tax=Sorangium sp. So ce296 TaxID=3133296 RepID=UPI003F63814B